MATSEIFMLLALVSTGIFLLQFVISIFFGGLDIDVDGDTNVDFDLGSLFSFKGLIHFLIGFGWTKVLFVGDAWYTYAYLYACFPPSEPAQARTAREHSG